MTPLPVWCSCGQPAVWDVDNQIRGIGHRSAVVCDACLPATKRWASNAGRDPPEVKALNPAEPTTLF